MKRPRMLPFAIFFTVLLIATIIWGSLAFAQTTNTYLLFGNGCTINGCHIQPAGDTDSPWGSPAPEFPPSNPFYEVGTHATFTTGLPVAISGYRSAAAIPTNVSGTGSGTFDWWIGNGTTGSFSVTLTCSWVANGKVGNYPRFLESCTTSTGPNGEMAPFTRDWYATPGERGFWSLFVLNMPGVNPPIVPRMELTINQ